MGAEAALAAAAPQVLLLARLVVVVVVVAAAQAAARAVRAAQAAVPIKGNGRSNTGTSGGPMQAQLLLSLSVSKTTAAG